MTRLGSTYLLFVFVFAPLALASSGCEKRSEAPKAAEESSSEISATVNESGFQPNTWTIPAGQEVTMTLTNTGTQEHNWTVLADRVASQDDLLQYIDQDGAVLTRTGNVAPGSSRSVTFRIDDPASYQVVCTQPEHFAITMQGTLVVK